MSTEKAPEAPKQGETKGKLSTVKARNLEPKYCYPGCGCSGCVRDRDGYIAELKKILLADCVGWGGTQADKLHKRIAELEAELADAKDEVDLKHACIAGMSEQNSRLAAQLELARKALEFIEMDPYGEDAQATAREALAQLAPKPEGVALEDHDRAEWLREGDLIYSLMHDGWNKGIERFKNRIAIRVNFSSSVEEDDQARFTARLFNVIRSEFGLDAPKPEGESMKVGISVECNTCKRRKAPRGRSVPFVAHGSYCTNECSGFYEEPEPGDLWPGETEEEFGLPVSANATREVDAPKPEGEK